MSFSRKFILILLIIILASATVSLISFALSMPLEVKEFDMHLNIGNYAGFNTNTSALYFGTMFPGGSGSRRLTLEDNADFSQRIEISTSGELAEWIWIEENNFVLNKNESKTIKIHVSTPKDAEFGNYTGKLRIVLRKIYISPQLF